MIPRKWQQWIKQWIKAFDSLVQSCLTAFFIENDDEYIQNIKLNQGRSLKLNTIRKKPIIYMLNQKCNHTKI